MIKHCVLSISFNSSVCVHIIVYNVKLKTKLNSVALVRERTIPTERPPPVGEEVPTFAGRGVSRGQRNDSPRPFSVF